LNAVSTGISVVALGLVSLEDVHLQGEPARIDQEPDLDLRVDAVLLAHPDPAQVVFLAVLEVQGRDVVEDQGRRPSGPQRVRPGGLGQRVTVVADGGALERRGQTVAVRGADPELVQDLDRGQLRGQLHAPGQDHRGERFVAQDVEPQPGIGVGQDLPQHLRRGAGHHRLPAQARARGHLRTLDGVQVQVQDLLAGMQPLVNDLNQHRELDRIVSRTHVLHDPTDPGALLHDLHRGRARGRLHPPDEPRHPTRLPTSAPKPPYPDL
jgi:hypothetical protein